jgi:myosin heavy subunit
MGESIKDLKDDIVEKTSRIEAIRLQMEEANAELARYKHEYNVVVASMKDAQADYRRCHEKESDVLDRLTKLKKQVEDTNNSLTAKMIEIVNLQKKINKMDKTNRELTRDLQLCGEVVTQTRDEVKTVRVENKAHKEALRASDVRIVKMKNQMDKILRERDLIANQMLRRTDENEVLDKEVSSLKLTVQRGDGRYNDRLDDISMLKNEVKSLRLQRDALKRALQNTTDMRHEILVLHRKLNQERVKGKVLGSEVVTPMNVHRWRKLRHGDPARAEMLNKCQLLQKKALLNTQKLAKSEEVIAALKAKIEILESEVDRRLMGKMQEKLQITRVSVLLARPSLVCLYAQPNLLSLSSNQS